MFHFTTAEEVLCILCKFPVLSYANCTISEWILFLSLRFPRQKRGKIGTLFTICISGISNLYRQTGCDAAPNAAVIRILYNCNTDLIWPFTAFRPGGTAGGRWHGSAGRSRTSARTAPWQRQRWSRRPCSAPHFGAVDVSQFFGFLVQKYASFVVHSANRQLRLCRV